MSNQQGLEVEIMVSWLERVATQQDLRRKCRVVVAKMRDWEAWRMWWSRGRGELQLTVSDMSVLIRLTTSRESLSFTVVTVIAGPVDSTSTMMMPQRSSRCGRKREAVS